MVIATGFFDGVHLGHRFVIEQLVKAARDRGDESMIVTFWPHPRNVLQDDARNLRLLTSLKEKEQLLRSIGVDRIEVLPFTKEFSRLTTREYLQEYVIGRFGGKALSNINTPEEYAELAAETGKDPEDGI
jgi:riboflavin kinase/FMN adenylyltransferase